MGVGLWSLAACAGLTVHQIDVGLGTCTLLDIDGGKTVMIDTGPTQAVAAVRRYLADLHLGTVDVLFVSHADSDHFGGAAALAQEGIWFDEVWDNGHVTNLPWVWPAQMDAYHRAFGDRRATIRPRQEWRLGPDTVMRCLYVNGVYADGARIDYDYVENNASAVLLLSYGRYRHLFAGDIHTQVDEKLPRVCGPVSVLTLAHHGIEGSSSGLLLQALRPVVTLISTPGMRAVPAPTVMDRLEQIGTDVYLTRRGGDSRGSAVTNIVVRTDGRTGFTVAGHRYDVFSAARSPWRRIILVTFTIIVCYGLLRATLASVPVAHR
jgi:competence protein ComEC